MESSHIVTRRAASLPILLCHGIADEVVTYRNGERSAEILRSSGFAYLRLKPYNGLGHYTILEEWMISGSDSTQHLAATDLTKRRVFAYAQWLW